jgi:hypothetical protein
LGVGGSLLRWIHSFLTDRVQAVAIGNLKLREAKVISGVPQGSVLGPILFLIHIANINLELTHASTLSFADNTRVLMKITDELDCERLQDGLLSIYNWALVNNMQFNGTKVKEMRYRVCTVIRMPHCYLASDSTEIEKQLV